MDAIEEQRLKYRQQLKELAEIITAEQLCYAVTFLIRRFGLKIPVSNE